MRKRNRFALLCAGLAAALLVGCASADDPMFIITIPSSSSVPTDEVSSKFRPAGTGSFAGLIQNNGQLPALFAPRPAGRVGDEDLFVLDAAQHDEMPGRGKMPGGHDGDDQLAAGKRVRNPLRL